MFVKNGKRVLALALMLALLCPSAQAASKKSKATPTPAPREITTEVVQEIPDQVQEVLDLAYAEWEELNGKGLRRSNKYTKWRNNGEWGWCGGFITWCMLQIGVLMEEKNKITEGEVDGVVHVKEAGVGKLATGYLKMHRTTMVPQKGFLVVYGKSGSSGFEHIGLVYDVEDLGDGKYRLTTIEGNMSSTVKMYIHDYDMNAAKKSKNLSAIPKEARDREESKNFSYKVQVKGWYINMFLMPWVPDGMSGDELPEPTLTPAPV